MYSSKILFAADYLIEQYVYRENKFRNSKEPISIQTAFRKKYKTALDGLPIEEHRASYESHTYHTLACDLFNADTFTKAKELILVEFDLNLNRPNGEPKTRFVVTGSRIWYSKAKMQLIMQSAFEKLHLNTYDAAQNYICVEGEAEGVDRYAREHFQYLGFEVERYLPQYKSRDDKQAPLERNKFMVDLPDVKAVIAFRSLSSTTNGTKFTTDYADKKAIKTFVVKEEKEGY